MSLAQRYAQLRQRLTPLEDFTESGLTPSRSLFDFGQNRPIPKRFEVWTGLAGMPIPEALGDRLQTLVAQCRTLLPDSTRFYPVIPQNYHWELFIIKRPAENLTPEQLHHAATLLKDVICSYPPLSLSYQGFLVSPDGTVLAQGYGDFDELRDRLRQDIPFASSQQSNLGHISLGRILDPIGQENFTQLKALIQQSQTETYGKFKVNQIQYVHETQWYMEQREIIAHFPFAEG